MKKFLSLVTLVALIFMLSCKRVPEEIKIGAILPLTGDGAKYGEEAKKGIDLAIENTKGIKVRVLYEDDQGTSKGAVSAFIKLIESSKVPIIIGPMYSSTALAIAPIGEKKKIIIFSPSASSPELTAAGDYFFRNWPSDIYEGGEMAKFSFKNLNLRKVAILSINLDYGVGLTKVFKESFQSFKGEILAVEYYEQGATDFRTQLSKIKALNPDGIYLPGYYTEIGLILRQAKEIGIKTQFLSCVGFDNPKILKIAGDATEEVIFARPYYNPKSEMPKIKDFIEQFTQKYEIPPGIYAAHAYDALIIIVEVIKKNGYTVNEIKDGIYSIQDFQGVTGNTSFDENGDVLKPIQIMKVSRGEFKSY